MRNKFGILVLVTVSTAALLGGWLGDKVSAGSSGGETEKQQLHAFTEALAVIQKNYIRDISSQELVESAIRGMLRTLDPHSSFFATSDYSRLQEEQQGKYYGLGISIRAEAPGSGRVVVVEPPAPGTPAYKAGLQAGDVISKINGEPIEDWDINEEVIPNLKGPKGTTVNISVERPGETELLDFTVERDEIPLYTIKFAFHIRPGIGYVRIDKFSDTTGEELKKALAELSRTALEGLILDLRDNPGGSLGAAIDVADEFLPKNQLVVSTRRRGGVADSEYRARHGGSLSYPMVVLINANSASASEIVAGALQDHDRALIVGETSFGKALVQTIYPLDGRRGLALTTGKYYTPSDRLIQRDYSQSFYDYFYNRRESADRRVGEGEEFETDSGRPVYAGGGIMPDEKVELQAAPRLVRLLDRRNLFFKFASKLASGEIKSDVQYNNLREESAKLEGPALKRLCRELKMSDLTMELFRQFLQEQEEPVRLLQEGFERNQDIMRNRLKQQLFVQVFGEEQGYEVGLELDDQVQRAIELLPRAGELARLEATASGKTSQ